MDEILILDNLKKYFIIKNNIFNKNKSILIKAVDNVSFNLKKGEIFGIVGESGCGKSTLARTILRLYKPDSGKIIFNNIDITNLKEKDLRKFRKDIQIIFQDPYTSLNPRMTIGESLSEPLLIYKQYKLINISKNEIKNKVVELLEKVGLSSYHLNRYPFEFSGGQRQRIGIARALILNPKLIVCDEPVSSLDVSIQAQILNLLLKLQKEHNLTYIFISHDLSVVKNFSDRIAIMYLGKIMEIGDSEIIYKNPKHPYTKALISNIPIPDPKLERNKNKIILKGEVNIIEKKSGCRFIDRCPIYTEICKHNEPDLIKVSENQWTACHNYNNV